MPITVHAVVYALIVSLGAFPIKRVGLTLSKFARWGKNLEV